MATVHVGLIGTGRIGRLHANHLANRLHHVRLAALCDVNAAAAAESAAMCGCDSIQTDYHAVLERTDLDAVVICSSTDTHPRLIRECSEAGKHIFCEKPIGSNLKEIDEALAAVKKAGVKLMMGFNRRFDANFARVRQAVASGEIGEPHLLHITSRDPAPPPIEYVRVSGGLFMDMTIHDFDMARFITGSEVTEVYTKAAVRVDPRIGEAGDVDTALIVLTLANGVIATIDNSRQAVYGYDQRVEVLGSAGSIKIDNNFPNSATISTDKAIQRDLPMHFFIDRYAESFLTEMRAFIECVRNDQTVPVTGADARAAFVIAQAAGESHASNKPVRL